MSNPADPFNKGLAEATKVMADNPELSVTFSVDPTGIGGKHKFGMMKRRVFLGFVTFWAISSSAVLQASCSHANENNPKVNAMSDIEFWSLIGLIQGSGWHDDTTDLTPLIAALSSRKPEEIQAFYETLAQKSYGLGSQNHYKSFSSFPGLSDTFLYTRLAVIAQGKDKYLLILKNPERFPKRSSNWLEGLLYVADEAYRNVTGDEFRRMSSVPIGTIYDVKGGD